MKQLWAVPLAVALTLFDLIRDPAGFFDPTTEEAPSGHTGENRFSLSGLKKQEHNR